MIWILLFLEQHCKKYSLCSKTRPKGISGLVKPILPVMEGKEESKCTLIHAAELERVKQILRRRKCVFTDQNLLESSEELERQCRQMPSWV